MKEGNTSKPIATLASPKVSHVDEALVLTVAFVNGAQSLKRRSGPMCQGCYLIMLTTLLSAGRKGSRGLFSHHAHLLPAFW